MNYTISLYKLQHTAFSSKEELYKFVSNLKDKPKDYLTLAVFPVVNTLNKHPEFFDDIYDLLFSCYQIDFVLLRALVILLNKKRLPPATVTDKLSKFYTFNIYPNTITTLLDLLYFTSLGFSFRNKLYDALISYHKNNPHIRLPEKFFETLMQDIPLVESNKINKLFLIINECCLETFLTTLAPDNKTISFLKHLIIQLAPNHPMWKNMGNIISSSLKDKLPLLLDSLHEFGEFLANSPNKVQNFLAYLMGYLNSFTLTPPDYKILADLLPYACQEKLKIILQTSPINCQEALALLDCPEISAFPDKLITLIKIYIKTPHSQNFKSPDKIIPVSEEVIKKLTNKQILKFIEKSYIQNNLNSTEASPLGFAFSSNALEIITQKLLALVVTSPEIAQIYKCFLIAYKK